MPDAYRVVLARDAERELRRFYGSLLKRILSTLRGLSRSPRPHGCKRLALREARYRLRVGDYRVLYGVDDRTRTVTVHKIRHRSEAYD